MKRNIKILMIILTCLVAGSIAFLFMSGLGSEHIADTGQPTESVMVETVSYSPSEHIITNINGTNKYLRTKITFELRSERCKAYFEKNVYKLRDTIISILRRKSESELTAPDAQQQLKADMKEEFQAIIDMSDFIDVYFDEYIIQ